MDGEEPVSNSVSTPVGASTTFQATVGIEGSAPEKIVFHWITDDQLTFLTSEIESGLMQHIWGCGGVALGLSPQVVGSLIDAFAKAPPTPLSALDVVAIVIFVATAAAAIVMFKIHKPNRTKVQAMVDEIRARSRR